MNKIAIIYWSGTGNTQKMAEAIFEGLNNEKVVVDCIACSDFNVDTIQDYSSFAFGCPSMGCEVLEEYEFAPMWDTINPLLNDRKVVLFGSYGWGDGQWMDTWKSACNGNVVDVLICNEYPSDEMLSLCREVGKKLI